MSTSEAKRAKRRKNKYSSGKSNSGSTPSEPQMQQNDVSTEENGDAAERIARLMDASDESDLLMPPFIRGPNPYLDQEKCLLCGVDRHDPTHSENEKSGPDGSDARSDLEGHTFSQLPLWVCPPCRRAADSDLNRKIDLKSVAEIPMPPLSLNTGHMGFSHSSLSEATLSSVRDITLDAPSLSLFSDLTLATASEPVLPNGSLCSCESCNERRHIAAEHDRETHELQKCWADLRGMVRALYSQEKQTLSQEESATLCELVARLCSRDPHQLFLRLESQVREFVIEKKVNLLKRLSHGYNTPPEAREVMSTLLTEYSQLCGVSRLVSEHLTDLKVHLERFKVTWELHNKHLYHSIVYADPAIHGSLDAVCEQLRNGALSKESYMEDTYPKLMHSFIDFRNEMSVILVIWHECQQLIEHYNKEQTALKVKQKWLKEDWEFFKAQRKILEQQVLKSNPKALTHSMEAQFTETMRNMLTGTKPTAEECHCPRCNRKRCPCDECTITHMITCGIINPEALETNGTHHTFNFPHDSNRYVIDVTPPSMSSTTSSSTSSSPVPISPAKMVAHLNACTDSLRNSEAPEEYSNLPDDNTDDVEEGEEENDEDDDGDDEEEDDDEEEEEDGDEDHDREEDEEEEEEDDDLWQDQKEFDQMLASGKLGMPATPAPAHSQELLKSWEREQPEEPLELSAQDYALTPCACHHCVLQTPPEPPAGTEETSCQCHVCLQQQGQTVSTALPTSLPLPPRPAQLHLYPHIHGTLPPATLTHQHVHVPHTHTAHITHAAHITHTAHAAARSLLQPQLYDLHGSLRSARLPLKLDFEDPEGIQNHLYHAYGDWDNTFDPRILVPGTHRYPTGLGSDLVPSPLTSDMPFSMESLSSGSHGMVMSNVSTSLASSSAFKAVAAGFATSFQTAYHLPPEPASVEEVSSANSHQASNSPDMCTKTTSLTSSFPDTCTKAVSLTSSLPVSFASAPPSSVSVPHNPPFTRPVTLGGNVGTQPAGKEQRTYAQPCKKHTLVPISSVHSTSGKVGVPPLLSSSLHGNVNVPVFSNGIQGQNNKVPGVNAKVPRSGMVSNPNSHTCNHSQHVMHTNSNMEGYADPHSGGVGTCTNAAVLPTTINNVSVGTSTLCADPDCQQHHDDNCDSIDDSCSEKSSSTSTSNNQKEGKYCDCCYCEFFGHGNPPVAQTSKNYAEMRERLRRRLKRRNEAKQEGGNKENQSGSHADLLEIKGLEELLRFINGTDSDGGHSSRDKLTDASSHQNTSSKAAKRARQKQRKAEEKARQELRQQHKQKALKEKAMSERVSNVKKESRSSGTTLKKKGKHKEDKTGKLSETSDTLNINSSAIASAYVNNKAENSSLGTKAKPHLKETTTSESKVENSATLNSNVSSSGNSTKTAVNQSSKPSQQQVVTSSGKPLTCLPPKANISHGPSVATLPFEPALDLDSIKTSLPHCADNSKVVPSNSSPSTFGTNIQTSLQGLPESPNAKKAKRRLDAQQMQDARRRLEAQQQVQQQLLEMEEQARQQQLLRQQQQQQQKLLQQQQQLQAHKQQQSLLPRQQQEIETKQLLMLSANPQQSNKTNSNGIQASNSVNSSSSEAKIQNGMSSSCKLAHSPAPTVADNPSSKDSPSPRPKFIQPGSNGTMATQMSLSPENRVRLAKIAEKRTETQEHEQVKNVKSKKNKKKNKAGEVSKGVDEVFMPRSESDLENGEIDDFERELEEFKRFCFDAPNAPKAKPKIQVNVNLKDLYLKKKTGLSCS